MKLTTFDLARVKEHQHAEPHGRSLDGQYRSVPLSYEDAVLSVAPAGGIWSNAREMAHLLQLELRRGRLPDGKIFADEKTFMRRRKPMVQMSKSTAYGLGLMVKTEHGLDTIGHDGNTLGFTALNKFFPQHNLGIVILVNAQGANAMTGLVKRRMLELLFDGLEQQAETGLAFVVKTAKESIAKVLEKCSSPPSAALVRPLLGQYVSASLGPLNIVQDGNTIYADVGEWRAALGEYKDTGTQLLMFTEPPLAGLSLNPQKDGALLLDFGQQKYLFKPTASKVPVKK